MQGIKPVAVLGSATTAPWLYPGYASHPPESKLPSSIEHMNASLFW